MPPAANGGLVRRRGDSLLLQRLGAPKVVRQKGSTISPESHGFWAFPFPFFSWFHCVHRYDDVMPKALRYRRPGFLGEAISPPADLEEADQAAWLEQREELRARWLARHGASAQPLRRFWQPGPFYCHLAPNGNLLGVYDWQLLSAEEFEHAVRRAMASALPGKWIHGCDSFHPEERLHAHRVDVDNFELFVPRRGGRLS